MLVLFESAAGYAVFKLLDEKKLKKVEHLFENFETPESASSMLKLKHFKKFKDTTEALEAAAATIEGKMSKSLKKLLKKLVVSEAQETLAVADAKLGNAIKDKFNIQCVADNSIQELMRCIRSQTEELITGLPQKEMSAMALGLAHSLSRYKLKFSPDKVDTMIVQAVGLLDDLDKELNNYIMRVREWYGWHFPELGKLITDNLAFIKTVQAMGCRTTPCDLSGILPEEIEKEVKSQAEISMGSEVSDDDIFQIKELCGEVISLTDYRAQLYDYLKNRMTAIAPNLTVLVGELVGARLIAHAGSLLNLAKHPASTVQILGAEKALFRALKTKHDTPKYGLIYHASLVGQANQKNKGKISRMLAAKAALSIRVDALGEDGNLDIGINSRAKLENRMKNIEDGFARKLTGSGKGKAQFDRYENKSVIKKDSSEKTQPLKRKLEIDSSEEEEPTLKKVKTEDVDDAVTSKKSKKRKSEGAALAVDEDEKSVKKKSKKQRKSEEGAVPEVSATLEEVKVEEESAKKKAKKPKSGEVAAPEKTGESEKSAKKKEKKMKSEDDRAPAEAETDDAEKSSKKKKRKKSEGADE